MARHIYHIPLQDARLFISQNRSTLNRLLSDRRYLEYTKRFGKGYYDAQIEAFITFFKIDKELAYALKTIDYLSSRKFFDELFRLLDIAQFKCDVHKVSERDFFYGLCYVLDKEKPALFEKLMHKSFLHFHGSLNNDSNVDIDYKEMSKTLANTRKVIIKESFGAEEDGAFFRLMLDGTVRVDERGKSIKTLRKRAYKKLFFYLLDNDDISAEEIARTEAQERLDGLRAL